LVNSTHQCLCIHTHVYTQHVSTAQQLW
jgi:hypothetical protein